jgi:hypothetical protein
LTVTLTDVTPGAGQARPSGAVGANRITGHRVTKTIQLKLAVKDADGNEPTYPVAIHLAVDGSRHGTLIISGANGTSECNTASFVWHEQDVQGNLINLNDQLGYRLGTLAWIAGFVADPAKPGGIAPVWTSAETLRITALGIESGGSQDQLTEQTIAVRPEAAKPDHLACWDVYPSEPCSNTFQYWTGYWSYADGTKTIGNPLETKLRVGPMQLYNAYFLYDSYGNLTYTPEASTLATQPASNVTVGFSNQVTTGPDFAGTMLATSWHNDPQMPQGQMQSTLTVCYPTDAGPTPDWQAGSVSKTITYQFDTGSTKLLAQKQSYEARFGMEDGLFPLEVSPEAGSGGLPTSAAGDTPRLVLLALNGTLVKTELLEGAVEPSLEPQKVWKKDGAVWSYTDDQDQSTVIETSDQPQFRLSLVDGDGAVVPEGELQAHLCPRYEHFTEGPTPPGQCTASPIAAGPGTGRIDSLTLNQPGAQRGYLGIELTKAPPKQGEYYIKVESLGPSTYRMRRQGQLTLDTHATGEHVGYFAICTVMGGEFLDESFKPITSTIRVTQPTPAYLLVLSSSSADPSLPAKLASDRQDGTVFQTGIPIALNRLASSRSYLGALTLLPERYTGEVPPERPAIQVALGSGTVRAYKDADSQAQDRSAVERSASSGEGAQISKMWTAFPGKLRLRFLTRDGTSLVPSPDASKPELAGTTQETEIATSIPGFAGWEPYAEQVSLQVEAVNPNDPTQIQRISGKVSFDEVPNPTYLVDTSEGISARFYDGQLQASSNIRADGCIINPDGAEQVVTLTDGVGKLVLYSVSYARIRASDSKKIRTTPTEPYTTSIRAMMLLDPATGPGEELPEQVDPPLVIRQWVDERSYERNRLNKDLTWGATPGANNATDWLEMRARDYLADGVAATPEADAVLLRAETVVDDWTLEDKGWSAAVDPATGETVKVVLLNPGAYGLRFARQRESFYYGLHVACAMDHGCTPFDDILAHEARHCWQGQLRVKNGLTDADGDLLPQNPPAAALELMDASYGMNTNENPEFHFFGDTVNDNLPSGSNAQEVHSAKERNAMRFERTHTGAAVSCAQYQWSDVRFDNPPVGPPALVGTLWFCKSQSEQKEFEGALVRIEQLGTDGTTWTQVALVPTRALGSLVATPSAGHTFRFRLVPPLECPGSETTSDPIVVP